MKIDKFNLRLAETKDVNVLEALIKLSSKKISIAFYTREEIYASLGRYWTVDLQLIKDRSYWICENENNKIVGCGGWSKRKLLFGKKMHCTDKEEVLIQSKDPAKIRAFFVHPDFTRLGIAKKLLQKCEAEAKGVGFVSFELAATLSGVKFYTSQGYIEKNILAIDLGKGLRQKVIVMTKN